MLEVDVEGEPITFVRLVSCPLVTILHLHGLSYAQELLRLILLVNAGGLNQVHERSGTTVHDRNLVGRPLYDAVFDAKTRERRHRSEDHQFELQLLQLKMYAVYCVKKK